MKKLMKKTTVFLVMGCLWCKIPAPKSQTVPADSPSSAEQTARLMIGNLLGRDTMFYGEYGLHYAEACAAVGALRFAAIQQDTFLLNALVSRYSVLLEDTSRLISRRPHVDQNVIGIVPLQIAMITGDDRFLRQGLTFADSQWDSTIDNGLTFQTRWWIDDMYMIGMLQMQAFRATGNSVYADHAARQFAAYLPRLQQENGLFYHGINTPHYWGRGNGWVAVAMTEVLLSLPETNSDYPVILNHYLKMMRSLGQYQSDDGMWRQLVDNPDAWAESSCTAMFAYAMAAGVNHGWLDDSYKPMVVHAWNALKAHVNLNGDLSEICVGTGQQDDIDYYLNRPRHAGDFHGQAPMLWLIAELLGDGSRFQENL